MKLLLICPSDECTLMGETVKEQLKREEEEYPNYVSIKKKWIMDIVAMKISQEELKKEVDSEKR